MIIYKKVDLSAWIWINTIKSTTVLELGAGFFNKLHHDVYLHVKRKIGIEIWKPYVDAHGDCGICEKIVGDVLDYEQLVDINEVDTILMVDILEHFDRDVAEELLTKLIKQFNTVLLMIPEGDCPQDEDLTGYGAHEYQTHRSTWCPEDFLKYNPTEILFDKTFHKNNPPHENNGCLFIKWKK